METGMIARVYLLDVPYHIDKTYDYFIPTHLRGSIVPGCFVIVPFGGGNTKQPALVTEVLDEGDYSPHKIKPVFSLFKLSEDIILNGELLKLCIFMKEYTFCTVGDAIKSILPGSLFTKYNEIYSIAAPLKNNITPDALIIYNYIENMGSVSLARIKSDHGNKAQKALNKLLEAGLVNCELEFGSSYNKTETYATLIIDEVPKLGVKQAKAVEYLRENGRTNVTVLKEILSVTTATLKSLEEKGIITLETVDTYRDPYK
ncbi:MAG: hypothetical protein FWF15_01880, partial [Oscillospiraceae bacterium]|nr:hypothetical protein [Oscillospiraceae bacterium]